MSLIVGCCFAMDKEIKLNDLTVVGNKYQLKHFEEEAGSKKIWLEKRNEALREFHLDRLEGIREQRHPASGRVK